MCAQEGRLPCQRVGSDRNTKITRCTLPSINSCLEAKARIHIDFQDPFPWQLLYNFVWPKMKNSSVSGVTGTVWSKRQNAVPFGGPLQHLWFIFHRKHWETVHQNWICFHSVLYVSCVRYHQGHSHKNKILFPQSNRILQQNLHSPSNPLLNDIIVSFFFQLCHNDSQRKLCGKSLQVQTRGRTSVWFQSFQKEPSKQL